MQIQVHCPKCNKTDRIEKENKDKGMGLSKNGLGIPMPTLNNGLETFSIAHADHTLILDIDHNGAVRGEKIIERIDRGLEKTLAAIATMVLEYFVLNDKKKNQTMSFFFITKNKMIHKLLLGIFSDLIFNLPMGSESLSSIKSNESIFELDGLTVYVGNWQKKMYNFRGDKMIAVYELDENTSSRVKVYIKKDKEAGIHDTAMMFHSDYISTPAGKQTMADIFQVTSPQALDMSNAEKAANALYSIIGSSIMNN